MQLCPGAAWFVLIPTTYLNVLSSRPSAPPTFPAGRPLWPPRLPKWVAWTVPQTVPWGVGPAWGSVLSVLHLFLIQKNQDLLHEVSVRLKEQTPTHLGQTGPLSCRSQDPEPGTGRGTVHPG